MVVGFLYLLKNAKADGDGDGDDSCPFCSCGPFNELSHDFEKPCVTRN